MKIQNTTSARSRRYEFIMNDAIEINSYSWTNIEIVRFEAFNPNGIHARSTALRKRIYGAVVAGKCKAGAILAYDDMLYTSEMYRLSKLCRVPTINVNVWRDMYKEHIEKVERYLVEIGG